MAVSGAKSKIHESAVGRVLAQGRLPTSAPPNSPPAPGRPIFGGGPVTLLRHPYNMDLQKVISFDDQAREELARLEAEAEEAMRALTPFRQRLERIQPEYQKLKADMEKIRKEMFPARQRLDHVNAKIKALRSFLKPQEAEKLNAMDRIERVLRRAGMPIHFKEIMERLKTEEKFDIGGKKPMNNLLSKLSTSERFKRFDEGIYGLTEWEE